MRIYTTMRDFHALVYFHIKGKTETLHSLPVRMLSKMMVPVYLIVFVIASTSEGRHSPIMLGT